MDRSDAVPSDLLVKALLALLVRARRAITDQPGWDDTYDNEEHGAVYVVAAIDNELGEVPEAGKGAYDRGRL
jgi:hypothetical protein